MFSLVSCFNVFNLSASADEKLAEPEKPKQKVEVNVKTDTSNEMSDNFIDPRYEVIEGKNRITYKFDGKKKYYQLKKEKEEGKIAFYSYGKKNREYEELPLIEEKNNRVTMKKIKKNVYCYIDEKKTYKVKPDKDEEDILYYYDLVSGEKKFYSVKGESGYYEINDNKKTNKLDTPYLTKKTDDNIFQFTPSMDDLMMLGDYYDYEDLDTRESFLLYDEDDEYDEDDNETVDLLYGDVYENIETEGSSADDSYTLSQGTNLIENNNNNILNNFPLLGNENQTKQLQLDNVDKLKLPENTENLKLKNLKGTELTNNIKNKIENLYNSINKNKNKKDLVPQDKVPYVNKNNNNQRKKLKTMNIPGNDTYSDKDKAKEDLRMKQRIEKENRFYEKFEQGRIKQNELSKRERMQKYQHGVVDQLRKNVKLGQTKLTGKFNTNDNNNNDKIYSNYKYNRGNTNLNNNNFNISNIYDINLMQQNNEDEREKAKRFMRHLNKPIDNLMGFLQPKDDVDLRKEQDKQRKIIDVVAGGQTRIESILGNVTPKKRIIREMEDKSKMYQTFYNTKNKRPTDSNQNWNISRQVAFFKRNDSQNVKETMTFNNN